MTQEGSGVCFSYCLRPCQYFEHDIIQFCNVFGYPFAFQILPGVLKAVIFWKKRSLGFLVVLLAYRACSRLFFSGKMALDFWESSLTTRHAQAAFCFWKNNPLDFW